MRPLLLIDETLLAEGAAFLQAQAAADPGRADPSVRLARRLAVLILALRSLAFELQRRQRQIDARAAARCLAHVKHDLRIIGQLLPKLAGAELPLQLTEQPPVLVARSLAAACLRVQAEMRTVALLARSAAAEEFSQWAQRRAQHYLRRGASAAVSSTRTRSRGTSARTSAASAFNAGMRG
ncbi:MAG: hypothetical protein RMK97_10495 [Sutterellaceae bacterium]|nr:hypothetical protein [Burkholderiaceae bacterium]MCX7902024.1 hypothetical protein [Burkholderiaceae bacterium]MDW8430910.1 hypothetical protein [Sutterellaceae bacterium]